MLFTLKCNNVTFAHKINLPYKMVWITHTVFNVSDAYFVLDHDAVFACVTNTNLHSICQVGFNLQKLLTLDTSSNVIRAISQKCFQDSNNLKILNLNDNFIHKIEQNAFCNLPVLLVLNLTGNLLSALTSDIFTGLEQIALLSINGTDLTHVDAQALTRLQLSILETQDILLCCLTPNNTHCTVQVPWYVSCTNLFPSKAIEITFYCISTVIFILNTVSMKVQRQVFVKKLDNTGAYGVTVGAINLSDVTCAIPLVFLWSANLYFGNTFIFCAKHWQSGVLCYFSFGTTLYFGMLSPLLICVLAVSRLMVVLHPLDTQFKDTSFVLKCIGIVFASAAFFAVLLTVLTWILTTEIPMFLCSPFIDLTGSVTVILFLTWFVVITQVGISICVLIVYIILIVSLNKSQQRLKEATSKKQSNFLLIIQIVVVTSSNIICWIPSGIIYLLSMFLEQYPIEMLIWLTVAVTPINSIANPTVFIATNIRKMVKADWIVFLQNMMVILFRLGLCTWRSPKSFFSYRGWSCQLDSQITPQKLPWAK